MVDPQRDIDRVLDLAGDLGVRITAVAETHAHNDYVSGGLELARGHRRELRPAARHRRSVPARPVSDGDTFDVGDLRVAVLHTPGHTHHHVAYAVAIGDGPVEVVLTGGSMLFGSTGRTDLVGPEHTDELTRAQYRSVRRLAADLPEDAKVLPTHGFGSFCSATPTSGDASTVAEQRGTNPALTQDEQTYVEQLLAGLDAFPAYYAHMGPANLQGPAPVDLTPPVPVDAAELRTGSREASGSSTCGSGRRSPPGTSPGSRSFELGTNFVTYLGWLVPWGAPLTLVGETPEQVADARRELVRIGVDVLAGAAVGPVQGPRRRPRPEALRSYAVSDFAGPRRPPRRRARPARCTFWTPAVTTNGQGPRGWLPAHPHP